MSKFNKVKLMILFLVLSLLSACGGGGGGAGAGGTSSTISYTGVTSQATIDSSNGNTISKEVYQGGGTGAVLGSVASLETEDIDLSSMSGRSHIVALAQSVKGALEQIDVTSASINGQSRALQTESSSISGSCGGSASYFISVDDQTGDFSGSFSFSSYCDFGEIISGSISFSGNIDPNTLVFSQIGMTFSNVTMISGSDSFTVEPSFRQSVFATVNQIITALEIPNSTSTLQATFQNALNVGLQNLDQAMTHIDEVRASVGSRLNVIESESEINESLKVEAQSALSVVKDLDYAEAITELNKRTLALQAAQQSFVKVQNLSLFEFI